jgi:hypothetical protein
LLSRLFLALAGVLFASGQATQSELLGLLRDSAGLPVPAASLVLTHLPTGQSQQQTSSPSGTFYFLGLLPGPYRLSITKENFTPFEQDAIVLRVSERLELPLVLHPAGAPQSIQISAAPPLLQSSRGDVSFHLEQRQIINLPLDGRNFVPLLALSPGVSLPPGSILPRINGSRPRVSEYIYDGISVLQPEPGQVAFFPVLDAVAEFRVETNSYSAEYGRSNGGVILVQQKSGSNTLHGTLFEFFRNEKGNARNLFATAGPKPRFRRNQFGFILGGPIQKNKTFFFADWQATRLSNGVVRLSTVPLSTEKQGVFSTPVFDPNTPRRDPFPSNTIPTQRLDRAALAVLNRYPSPNVLLASGSEATVNNYRREGNDQTTANHFDGRLDRYFATKHRLFLRHSYFRDDSRPTTPLPDGSGNLTAGLLGNTFTQAGSTVAEHTATLSSSTVNQLRFGHTGRSFQRTALRLNQPLAQATLIPNLPTSSFDTVLPTYDLIGYQQLGPPAASNANFSTSVTQLINSFASVRGSHSIKLGFDLRTERLNVLQPSSPTGNFQFTNISTAALTSSAAISPNTGSSLASFLLGQVSRFSLDSQPDSLQLHARIAEAYAQDDWRLTPRLSLNLGLRYTLNFPSTVQANRGAVFNLATQQLDFLGSSGFSRSARNLDKTGFAPRLGLAFKLNNSLVLRSGYGLTWIEQAGITTPFTTPLFPFIQTLGQQSLDNRNPAFILSEGPTVTLQPPSPNSGLGQGVFGVQRDNGSGYAQQWNLSLQKTLASNWSLELGYLGSKLTRLGVPDVNLNQLTVEQLALSGTLADQLPNPFFGQLPANSPLGAPRLSRAQLLRPYPRFTTVALYRNNVGHSTYHSLQARLEKRLSNRLLFTAAYTFSRLIDDAGAVFDSAILSGPAATFQAADSFNKRLEKDASTGNIPHIFSSSIVYQLPRHWQLAAMARAQSGSPLAVTQATNFNAFAGFGIQRPNRLSNPTLDSSERTTSRWFNTGAFAQAPQFRIGDSSRNPVTGPGYTAVDLMLGRTFHLRERLRAEFRAEAFNLTNTPPLGNPNTSFGNPAFGSITTALDPRVFELVFKLHF